MNESGAKQQIVDTIQGADTILVTVSSNPSVDELSAALGLTMYLNDFGKHATAVVSGALPPAITFLEPEKTFEPTVDSLRDFVIALDKEKADHLRYKVEGDVVKIFITPYKTVISDKDLEFSQGDYNVEMVIALGVTDQDHLDKALSAHGKIFHDASVATIGLSQSTLGTIDWTDESASSVSELTTSLMDGLKDDEHPVSSQVASSLLTGIVAATDRFSNDKTSARTMSLAGELMAAGANQQLIASKLREGAKLPMQQDNGKKKPAEKSAAQAPKDDAQPKRRDGGLSIAHARGDDDEAKPKPDLKPVADKKPDSAKKADTPPKDAAAAALDEALKKADTETKAASKTGSKTPEDELSEQLAAVAPGATPSASSLADELVAASASPEPATPAPQLSKSKTASNPADDQPIMGGTLNATVEQAARDKRNADTERNKTILSHGAGQYVGGDQPTFESPLNGAGQTGEAPSIDPFANITAPADAAPLTPIAPPTPSGTLADIDQQNRASTKSDSADASPAETPSPDAAKDAVDAVMQAAPDPQPFDPVAAIENAAPAPAQQVETETVPAAPTAPNTPPPPPMPDFSQLPPLPPPAFPPGDTPTPPAPFGVQPPAMPEVPLPPEQLGSVLPAAPDAPTPPPGPADPKQFQIPGQQ